VVPPALNPPILHTAYELAQDSRISKTQPYPNNWVGRTVARRAPASKGAIPTTNSPDKISVQCGTEANYLPLHNWSFEAISLCSGQILINTLCNKFNSKVELRTKATEDRKMFGVKHFGLCWLGTKKGGSVKDYKSFVDFLKGDWPGHLWTTRPEWRRTGRNWCWSCQICSPIMKEHWM
jgi:hypothetical protein